MAIQVTFPETSAGLSTDSFTYVQSVYINIDSWNYIKGFKSQHIIPHAYVSEAAYRGGAHKLTIPVVTEAFLDEVAAGDAGIERAYAQLKARLALELGEDAVITDI